MFLHFFLPSMSLSAGDGWRWDRETFWNGDLRLTMFYDQFLERKWKMKVIFSGLWPFQLDVYS